MPSSKQMEILVMRFALNCAPPKPDAMPDPFWLQR
jgi:hypothetical protein